MSVETYMRHTKDPVCEMIFWVHSMVYRDRYEITCHHHTNPDTPYHVLFPWLLLKIQGLREDIGTVITSHQDMNGSGTGPSFAQ